MSSRQRAAMRAAVVLALIGLGLSAYLTVRHFAAAGGARSVCSLSVKLDCDVVNTSEYSEVLGIPISLLGATLYLAIIVLGMLGLQARPTLVPWLLAHLTLVSAGALGYSAFLAAVSHFVIQHWCLFCIGLYAVNAGLLLTAAWGAGIPLAEQVAILRSDWSALRSRRGVALAVGLSVVFAIAAAATWKVRRDGAREKRDADVVAEWKGLAPVNVPIAGTEPVKGAFTAPVVIVEYFDFLCAHCKKAATVIDRVVKEQGDRVRLVLKHVPLDGACNAFADPHPGSCRATAAALCASKQDRYWEMHDWLFLMQGEINATTVDAKVDEIAGKIGLDREALKACMAAPETSARIESEIREAIVDLRLESTPTLFINGRGLAAAPDAPLLRRLIDEAAAPAN